MIWRDLIETYDKQAETRHICPIAHTQIIARIAIMLDEQSNILAAAKIRQSIFAPCTAKSECRSSNIAPHLVYDNASYVTNIYPDRHKVYIEQLENFVADTGDDFCKIVLEYLQKETIVDDLQYLINLRDNPMTVITFVIKGWDDNTVNNTWIDYHLSKLPQNGICAITGQPDFIPDSYPGNIRYPSDMAKLFCTKPDKLNGMPQLRPGYIASQKIIHTLQSFFVGWEEQGEIPPQDVVIAQKQLL